MDNLYLWDAYNSLIPLQLKNRIRKIRRGSHYNSKFNKNKIIYIHIPKTGGTSLAKAIFGESAIGHGHYTCEDFYIENQHKFKTYYSFAFVRNPWDRVVSAYHYLASPPNWVGGRTRNVSKYINSKSVDFESFIILLEKDKVLQRWTHMIPQYKYITLDGEISVDHVAKFESIEEEAEIISKNIGLTKFKLPHFNKSDKKKHYSYYYNDHTREIVRTLYKHDIELFNYEFEDR